MDRGERFFFATNAAAAVGNLIAGNILLGMVGLAVALWLITKPLTVCP